MFSCTSCERTPKPALTTALRRFLSASPEPYVIADHPNDSALLQHASQGFDLPKEVVDAYGPAPKLVLTKMIKDERTQRVLEDYFVAHPDHAKRRHPALVDAETPRITWLAPTGRTSAPWSPALRAPR